MPKSNKRNRDFIIEYLQNMYDANEKLKILDVGIGYGLYGSLLRRAFPDSYLEGIEPFKAYDTGLWKNYDHVHNTLFENTRLNPDGYHVILLIDVLEHMNMRQAENAINRVKKMSKHIIISTPITKYPQHSSHGNDLEEHKITITKDIIETWGFIIIKETIAPTYALFPPFAKLGVARYLEF